MNKLNFGALKGVKSKVVAGAAEASTIETEQSKRKKMFSLKKEKRNINIFFVVIPAVLIILLAFLTTKLLRIDTTYTLDGPASQYFNNQKYKFNAGAEIVPQTDGKAIMTVGDFEQTVGNLPIYYDDKNIVVFPMDTLYYEIQGEDVMRVPSFSELNYNEYGLIDIVHSGESVQPHMGFLYDGKNTYLFTQPVTLRFNGYKFELGAMSYVYADVKSMVSLYNRATGEMFSETPLTAVTASVGDGGYSVSLLGDTLTRPDGSWTLLYSDVNIAESMF